MTESMLPTSRLASSLVASKGLLTDDDWNNPHHEQPKILFAGVRQKDIKDARGAIVRSAGAFCFGNKDDLTYEDRSELLLTILEFSEGRVYFKDLNETQPTCKSMDMKTGSAERTRVDGRDVYGDCATCYFNQWGSANVGRGKRCRENRRLFCMDWSGGGPIILTIGVSSLESWKAHDKYVANEARVALGENADGSAPFMHHLLRVKASLEYKPEPSGHYIVKWSECESLPMPLQQRIAAERMDALNRLREAANRAETEIDETPF